MASSAPSNRVRHHTKTGFFGVVTIAWTCACFVLVAACSSPSNQEEASNLHGLFDRDGGSSSDSSIATATATASFSKVEHCFDASKSIDVESFEIAKTLGRPGCRDAEVFEWRDAEGSPRYACLFTPKGVEARAPLPLVLYFPSGDERLSQFDKVTDLRKAMGSFVLSADQAHVGFIVLAVQGRFFKTNPTRMNYDTWHLDEKNMDLQAIEHFAQIVSNRNIVNSKRVYTMGAREGGKMATFYSMHRAQRIAAFATYDFDGANFSWRCESPPPAAMMIYRAEGGSASCEATENWIAQRAAQKAETVSLRLGEGDVPVPTCTTFEPRKRIKPVAKKEKGIRWVKMQDVLKFLSQHSL